MQHLLVLHQRLRIRYRLCHLWLIHDVIDHLVMQEGRLLTVPFQAVPRLLKSKLKRGPCGCYILFPLDSPLRGQFSLSYKCSFTAVTYIDVSVFVHIGLLTNSSEDGPNYHAGIAPRNELIELIHTR